MLVGLHLWCRSLATHNKQSHNYVTNKTTILCNSCRKSLVSVVLKTSTPAHRPYIWGFLANYLIAMQETHRFAVNFMIDAAHPVVLVRNPSCTLHEQEKLCWPDGCFMDIIRLVCPVCTCAFYIYYDKSNKLWKIMCCVLQGSACIFEQIQRVRTNKLYSKYAKR